MTPDGADQFDEVSALAQAVAHHHAQEWSAAESVYKKILARQPDHPDANHNLGLLAAQFGQPDLACNLIRRALRHRNDHVQYWLSHAEVLRSGEKMEDARQVATRGILNFFNLGRPQEVEMLSRYLVKHWPQDGFGWKALGTALCLGGHKNKALPALKEAVRLLPENAEAHNSLGNVYREIRKPNDAIRHYRRALELSPDYEIARTSLTALLFETGKVADVLGLMSQSRHPIPAPSTVNDDCIEMPPSTEAIEEAYAFCHRILNTQRFPAVNAKPLAEGTRKRLGRYLVSKGWEGFCDRLQCLSHCLQLALKHDLVLQVNWEDRIWSHGTGDFYRYFDLVDVPYVTSAEEIPPDLRIYPKFWQQGLGLPMDDWIYQVREKLLLDPAKTHRLDQVWVHPSVGFRRYDCNQLARHLRLTPEAVVAVSALLRKVPESMAVVHLRGTDRKVDDERWQILRTQAPVACIVSDDAGLVARWMDESPDSIIFSDTLVNAPAGGHKLAPQELAQHGFDKFRMNIRLIADFILIAAAVEAFPLNESSLFFKMARRFGACGGVTNLFRQSPAKEIFATKYAGYDYALRISRHDPA